MARIEKFKTGKTQSKSLTNHLHGYTAVTHTIDNVMNTLLFDTYKDASRYYTSIKIN